MLSIVSTKYGKLQSVASNAGFALFRGIPYAAPPVGDLRWMPPREPAMWEGIRVCDTYGSACCQFDRWDSAVDDIVDDAGHSYVHIPGYPYPPKMSEDCLYLNIYTPAESEHDRLPVMLYVHGGGCQQWYGSDYEYCGDGFCRHGCIIVSINYRLNVFGYFAHPELAGQSGVNASGNYGLMDQLAALKWVYENIAGFGGDPENITIFGQSAGGGSCMAMWCSPLSGSMIRRISMQSSAGIGRSSRFLSREQMEEKGVMFMREVGCASIAEMRALPWQVLRDANDRLFGMFDGFNIYTDGYVLPEATDLLITGGKVQDIEMIIGCTADEGPNGKPPVFGIDQQAEVWELARLRKKQGAKPVYCYVFDREQPGDDAGVPHSCDNRYQFGTLDGCWRPYEDSDWALSETMQSLWANFARTGDPNGENLPCWETFADTEQALWLRTDGCRMK